MSHKHIADRNELLAKSDAQLAFGIAGSARKHGNSAALLRRVLNGLKGEFRTELVFLADIEIRPCAGCHDCETKGGCRVKDGMTTLYPKLLEADAILLASPAYMGGIASRMQAFMERTWPLRKGQLRGRIASYIVTGRRRIGMATGVMSEYFTRLGVTTLPGVLGYAFEPGRIQEDSEAITQADALVERCRDHLLLMKQSRAKDGYLATNSPHGAGRMNGQAVRHG